MNDFKLDILGSEWSVVVCEKIVEQGNDNFLYGLCDHDNKIISISTQSRDGRPLQRKELLISFYHELIHAILGEGQYKAENKNEPMVEWIARCLASTIDSINKIHIL